MSDDKLVVDFTEAQLRLEELIQALDPLLPAFRYASMDPALVEKLEAELGKSRRFYADVLARYPRAR